MTVENLEKELKQEKLHSIYLFYGEETYLLENAVKKIKKIFGDLILGINYIQINEKKRKNQTQNQIQIYKKRLVNT